MVINKDSMMQELIIFLEKVFQLPEVNKVRIRDVDIASIDENNKLKKCIEESYHDVLSDIDIGVHVTLHPEDIDDGHGYHTNPQRIGLTREQLLGLACTGGNNGLFQMFRVIFRNGIRFDIGMYITKDITAPIYRIPREIEKEMRDEGKFWERWSLQKADEFWFTQIHSLAKLMRGDYLIADHLANMQINETLVAQMLERDNLYGTNIHRYGYREKLAYKDVEKEFVFSAQDETYNMIADKLVSAAVSYDRLIQGLNPLYEERRNIFFKIWKQYEAGLKL